MAFGRIGANPLGEALLATVCSFALALQFPVAALAKDVQTLPPVVVDAPRAKPKPARRAEPARRAAPRRNQTSVAAPGAGQPASLAPIEITASAAPSGAAAPPPAAASERVVPAEQVTSRPFSRPAEALEVAPGLVVTQHSGEGKANQYMLRGFQLDHGSDVAITLDGMPLNMPTHGHGQGYADANFIIPELLGSVVVRKGPFYADEGDFSSAGALQLLYVDSLEKGVWSSTAGSFGYLRLFGAKSVALGEGTLTSAAEAGLYNGPWRRPDEMRKINGVMRWTRGTQDNGFALTGMAYANRWYSTDQIPQRAVVEGLIPLYGTLNPTDGGNTSRFSLSGRWSQTDDTSSTRIEAYAIRSTLNLYNDFTWVLSNSDFGDQFRQFDRRTILGLKATQGYSYALGDIPVETRFGLQARYDNIRVGIQNDVQRQVYSTVRNDAAGESSVGLWTDTTLRLSPWLRATAGLRLDRFAARISSLAQPWDSVFYVGTLNNGAPRAALVSPKGGVVLGPFMDTELFLNVGQGFHSNDARGVVTRIDPNDGTFVTPTPFLSRSQGAEIGVRTRAIPGLESSLSLFVLDFASENLFEGDTGSTVVGRPSRRVGLEWTNHYHPFPWMRIDADLAITRARFKGSDFAQQFPAWLDLAGYPQAQIGNFPGNYIPEAPNVVASMGVEVGEAKGWFAAARLRYFGPRPLTEDGAFRSPATALLNGRIGYRFDNGVRIQLDGYNLTNSRTDQISYAYGSFLRTDPLFQSCQAGVPPAAVCSNGVMNNVFHPVGPLALRLSVSGNF